MSSSNESSSKDFGTLCFTNVGFTPDGKVIANRGLIFDWNSKKEFLEIELKSDKLESIEK